MLVSLSSKTMASRLEKMRTVDREKTSPKRRAASRTKGISNTRPKLLIDSRLRVTVRITPHKRPSGKLTDCLPRRRTYPYLFYGCMRLF